jgi:uncharacterized protein
MPRRDAHSDGDSFSRHTGLSSEKLGAIHRTIGTDSRVREVVLFGSRAKGNWREGSDIDLAVSGEGIEPGDASLWAGTLEEALFPWSVDVVLLNDSTDTALKEHIDRVGVRLLKRER